MSAIDAISAPTNASCEGNLSNPFSSLPDEVIAEIFNRCTLPEIVMLTRVCRQFFLIVESLPVWRLLFERAWMGPYPTRLDSQRGAAYQYFCQLQLLIKRGRLGEIISTTSLLQHTTNPLCIAVTPDEKIILGFFDGTIKILDVTGKQIACLIGHEGWIYSVAVTPDGKKIISGSLDHTIRIWNSENGEQIACLRGHENLVDSVIVTPDGKKIISKSSDDTIRIWNSETGEQIACFSEHVNLVDSVIVTPDGTKIISGSEDGTIRIWDSETGQEIACLRGHESWVTSVIVTPDGKKIISADLDHTIRIWDSETGKQIACLRGHESWVRNMAATPDGKIISLSAKGTIEVHACDPKAFEQLCEIVA